MAAIKRTRELITNLIMSEPKEKKRGNWNRQINRGYKAGAIKYIYTSRGTLGFLE